MSNQETFEQAEIIMDDFSPLDAPVKQRSYTNHKVYDDAEVIADLEEPTYQPPTFNDFEGGGEEAEKEPSKPFNEAFSELDGKEKTMGAEMMAEMALDMYEKGCGFLGKVPEISEDKLDLLIAEGEIDPNIQLPTESGNLSVKEFATEYNSSIKDAFEVSDDFKDKVRPPLIRVFKKRGIGMTDEQLLAYYFVTDLGTKTAQAVMLKKTANNILDSLRENTLAIRETQRPTPKPTPTPTPTQSTTKVEDDSIEFYESVSNVQEEIVSRPKRTTPKTNLEEQIEFFEPEEAGSVFNNLKSTGGFKEEYIEPSNMPQFGDKSTLDMLSKLSDEPTKPVRKRRTTATAKKTRTPRTPRTKK
jgi:hypothetical protein